MRKSHLLFVCLLVVAGGLMWIFFRGEAPDRGAEAAPVAAGESGAAAPEQAASVARERNAAEAPAVAPRPLPEIRKSLIVQAREVIARDLGGADAAAKEDLARRLQELESLSAGGLGPNHPGTLLAMASLSRKLDRPEETDQRAWLAETSAYVDKRLEELDRLPEGESPEGLLARWRQEFSRDDLPEAILLRRFNSVGTKEKMRAALLNLKREHGGFVSRGTGETGARAEEK